MCAYDKGVKLRRDKIVVALENKVYVYNFADLQLVNQIETTANPKGNMLVALCDFSHLDPNLPMIDHQASLPCVLTPITPSWRVPV